MKALFFSKPATGFLKKTTLDRRLWKRFADRGRNAEKP